MKSNEESNEELLNKIYCKNIKIHNNNKEKKTSTQRMSKKFFVSFILKKVHFALTDPLVNIKKVAKTML